MNRGETLLEWGRKRGSSIKERTLAKMVKPNFKEYEN